MEVNPFLAEDWPQENLSPLQILAEVCTRELYFLEWKEEIERNVKQLTMREQGRTPSSDCENPQQLHFQQKATPLLPSYSLLQLQLPLLEERIYGLPDILCHRRLTRPLQSIQNGEEISGDSHRSPVLSRVTPLLRSAASWRLHLADRKSAAPCEDLRRHVLLQSSDHGHLSCKTYPTELQFPKGVGTRRCFSSERHFGKDTPQPPSAIGQPEAAHPVPCSAPAFFSFLSSPRFFP